MPMFILLKVKINTWTSLGMPVLSFFVTEEINKLY